MGKIYIKRALLNKSGLTAEERREIGRIPDFTMQVIQKLGKYPQAVALIREVSAKRDEISRAARVLRTAVVYDALTCPKLYKEKHMSVEEACRTLLEVCPWPETRQFAGLLGVRA